MLYTPIPKMPDHSATLAACLVCLFLSAQSVAAHGEEAQSEHSEDHHHEEEHDHATDDDHAADDGQHLIELEGFRVLHGWTNATRQNSTLVFMELENTGTDSVTLLGAEAGIAAQATLVGFRLVDGAPVYEPLPSVILAAGRKMQLAPNGLAIELGSLSEHLNEGDHFDMELHTSLGHVDIHVDVEAADAMQHSHAGHAH